MTEEVRPVPDKTVAQARFQECVLLAKQVVEADRAWAKLGRLLTQIDIDRDYERLGFDSMGKCIMEIVLLSGYERASLYHFKALYLLAAKNAGENVMDMRIGSAERFVTLPEHLQRDERVQMAASEAPEKFKATIIDGYPEVHWEEDKVFKIPESRWLKMLETINYYREVENDPDMSDQQAIEEVLVEYKELRSQLEAMAVQK